MSGDVYPDIELMQLSTESVVVRMDDDFIMIDNIDDAQTSVKERMRLHPVRLSFSIAIICTKGSIKFNINLDECELRANDVMLMQPGMIAEFVSATPDCHAAAMAWNDNYFKLNDKVDASISLQQLLRSHPICHMQRQAIDECLLIYRLMKDKILECDNIFRKGAVMGYMQVLIYNAYHYLLSDDKKTGMKQVSMSRQQELYNRFIKEVQEHYMQERSISFYATQLCVTPKYLSQVVKLVSGRLAGEWISDYVILEAKVLLNSRKYSMQQISDMLNFANQSFFAKYFKEKMGCTPSKYQNSF